MNRIFTFFISALILISIYTGSVSAQNCTCWQEQDTSFHVVKFSTGSPPYYRNDDGSSNAITLPFNFCFWGQTETTVYINNNGNITFGSGYSPFSADTFPNVSVPAMIAAFWADVDTKNDPSYGYLGRDAVYYQLTSTHLIVQWDTVGYVGPAWCLGHGSYGNDSLNNTFQLILTNGTDPILPMGNNVEFCYKTMHWTTGGDSPGPCADGGHGFGGDPANVGANEGDGVRSIQIGLFASPSNNYVGQFPPAPAFDGVYWLDNKSFIFNLCSGSIAPLTSGISPCDTFKICIGDSVNIPLYFLAPLQGDSVWSNLKAPIPSGVSIISNHPGPTDSLTVKVVGSGSNYGDHIVSVYAYDNQVPSDTTNVTFVVEVDSVPKVHLMAVRDTICMGDSAVLTASGGIIYTWSTGATTSSIKVSPPATHTYTIGVSRGVCAKDTQIQLVVIAQPVPSIVAKPDTICSKDSVLLIASGGGKYVWSTGQTNDSIWVTPVSTKTYNVTAYNGYCSDSSRVSVFVKTTGMSKLIISKDSICPFQSVTITDSGGTAFLWNNGATASSIIVSPGVNTTYTVYSAVACKVDTLVQNIKVIPFPVPVIKGSSFKCIGLKDTLTVSGGSTYIWSNGKTSTSYITGPINADSTITVTAYNSLGCSHDTTFGITVTTLSVLPIPSAIACQGNQVVLKANGGLTYRWSPGGETTDSITVYDSVAKIYTVTITKICTTTRTVTVTPIIPPLNVCCDKTIMIGDDTVITAGGVSKYLWVPSNSLNCDTCPTVIANPTVTTTYTVTGIDSAGCSKDMVITITVETPCFNFTVPNVFTPTNAGTLGLDNMFYIKTTNISSWSILVYDRWGKEMFKSTNPNESWGGKTEGGGDAPAGVYYYMITGTCQSNTYKKDGFVQLIR